MSARIDNICNDLFHEGKITFAEWTVISQGVADYDHGHVIRDTAVAQCALLDEPATSDDAPDIRGFPTPAAWRTGKHGIAGLDEFVAVVSKLPTPAEVEAELEVEVEIPWHVDESPRCEDIGMAARMAEVEAEVEADVAHCATDTIAPSKEQILDRLNLVEDVLEWCIDYGMTYQSMSGGGFVLSAFDMDCERNRPIPERFQEVLESIHNDNYVGKVE